VHLLVKRILKPFSCYYPWTLDLFSGTYRNKLLSMVPVTKTGPQG